MIGGTGEYSWQLSSIRLGYMEEKKGGLQHGEKIKKPGSDHVQSAFLIWLELCCPLLTNSVFLSHSSLARASFCAE